VTLSVVVRAWTVDYVEGGGHLWAYLNWALGLQRAGCHVWWLEVVADESDYTQAAVAARRSSLAAYGLADRFVACSPSGRACAVDAHPPDILEGADALLDLSYNTPASVLAGCGRTALIDIDPGQLQCWWADGHLDIAEHDLYFTTGERIGHPETPSPTCGVAWLHTPPPVDTLAWSEAPPAAADAAFTTITHWDAAEYFVHGPAMFENSKRAGFLPYMELPEHSPVPLELALPPGDSEHERASLRQHGWRVQDSLAVAGSPEAYRSYIRGSRGEFSCAKPSTVYLSNAWMSDRTLCYLASGRPAVVQHTGPSELVPDDEGILRFQTPAEAVRALHHVTVDYDRHANAARQLAIDVFDAKAVVTRVLERLM
jgi:hypothetical protein